MKEIVHEIVEMNPKLIVGYNLRIPSILLVSEEDLKELQLPRNYFIKQDNYLTKINNSKDKSFKLLVKVG